MQTNAINCLLVQVPAVPTETRGYAAADGERRTYPVQIVDLHIPGARHPKEFPRRIPKLPGKRGEAEQFEAPLAAGWYEQDYSEPWLDYAFNRVQLTLAKLVPVSDARVKAILASWGIQQPQAAG